MWLPSGGEQTRDRRAGTSTEHLLSDHGDRVVRFTLDNRHWPGGLRAVPPICATCQRIFNGAIIMRADVVDLLTVAQDQAGTSGCQAQPSTENCQVTAAPGYRPKLA